MLVTTQESSRSHSGSTFATAGVMLVVFLFAIDATIVSSAMPTVVAKLGDLDLYSWVFSIYMLASALATPIFGKLSDLFSRRRLILFAIGLFMLGSVLCGLAQSMLQLIVFRGLQGIGGGAIYSLSFILVGVVFPPHKRAAMQGLIASVWGVASVLGPLAGGLITQYWNWHWIFFINLPSGIVAAALIAVGLHEPALRQRRPELDVRGAGTLLVGLLALLYALLRSGKSANPLDPVTLGLFAVALATLGLFTVLERRASEPLIPLGLFRWGLFRTGVLLAMLAAVAVFGIIGYLPLYVQGVLAGSASKAGVVLLPVSVGWTLGSLIAGRTMNRLGYRAVCLSGATLMAGGYAFLLGSGMQSGLWAALVGTFFIGIGTGMIIVTSLVAAQSAVPFQNIGVATSTLMLIRTFGGALGISIMGSVLFSSMHRQLLQLSAGSGVPLAPAVLEKLSNPQTLLDPASRALLPAHFLPALTQALSSSLWYAFTTGLVAVVIGVVLSATMSKLTPASMRRPSSPAPGRPAARPHV